MTVTTDQLAEHAEGTTAPEALYTSVRRTPSVALAPPPYAPPRGYRPRAILKKPTIAVRAGDGLLYFQEFLLSAWNRSARENVQVSEHTSGWTAYFWGSKPTVWTFSGVVWDGYAPYDWAPGLIDFYETHLKGSQAPSVKHPCYVQFGSRLVTGFVGGMTMMSTLPHEQRVAFTLEVLSPLDEAITVVDYAQAARDARASRATQARLAAQAATAQGIGPTISFAEDGVSTTPEAQVDLQLVPAVTS